MRAVREVDELHGIRVKRDVLLEALETNRKDHRVIFEEALEGYRTKLEEILSDRLAKLKEGRTPEVRIGIPVPEDHTRDYDRIIKMVELSLDDTLELEEVEFAQFIMDDWHWKRQFLFTNSAYSETAGAALESLPRSE